MKWIFPALILGSQLSGILAAPASKNEPSKALAIKQPATITVGHSSLSIGRRGRGRGRKGAGAAGGDGEAAAAAAAAAAAGAGADAGAAGEAAAGGGGEAANELEAAGAFDQPIALGGGDVKTDVLFTKSAVGALEVEFQNQEGRTLTVTENKTPAAPPTGFIAIEPSSFQINLAEGADGLTLQKVDFVFDVTNPDVAAMDLAQSRVGLLCTEREIFIVDDSLGELEFEAEENEISLIVNNMNGEWGIFAPEGAVGAASAAAANATAGADPPMASGAIPAGEPVAGAAAANTSTDAIVLVNGHTTEIEGDFDTPISVPGGNEKTDIKFPAGVAGILKVEYNGTAENTITVTENSPPTANAPPGFLFVDPSSFTIKTQAATDSADIVKVDYIFTQRVTDAVDVSQGLIGKLDPATNTFVTEGLGEFEFQVEEDRWSLSVGDGDLNGEWVPLVPEAAEIP
ncbi:hypothetical protein FQN50_006398 [Emmonsiellopsis sp. PD_5]|nr:hypothetical protein FQN50_006398 [Emmonsiellopsis sp. PD_5]